MVEFEVITYVSSLCKRHQDTGRMYLYTLGSLQTEWDKESKRKS